MIVIGQCPFHVTSVDHPLSDNPPRSQARYSHFTYWQPPSPCIGRDSNAHISSLILRTLSRAHHSTIANRQTCVTRPYLSLDMSHTHIPTQSNIHIVFQNCATLGTSTTHTNSSPVTTRITDKALCVIWDGFGWLFCVFMLQLVALTPSS